MKQQVQSTAMPTRSLRWSLFRRRSTAYKNAIWYILATSVIDSILNIVIPYFGLDSHESFTWIHGTVIFLFNTLELMVLYHACFCLIHIKLRGFQFFAIALLINLSIVTILTLTGSFFEKLLFQKNFINPLLAVSMELPLAIVASIGSMFISNIQKYQATLIEQERLHNENIHIRLNTLEQHLSPHFLFNSLNTLDSLIAPTNSTAHDFIQQLSSIYRYTLRRDEMVSLHDEMVFTHNYIELMSIRFGKNTIHVKQDIDNTLMDCQLPPISLQMLVENAFKHNVVSSRMPLQLNIVSKGGEEPSITVSNNLQLRDDTHPSSGSGLSNLSQRYRLLCGRDITIHNIPDTFCVEIPLLWPKKEHEK